MVVRKGKDILEVLSKHWGVLGRVSRSGEDDPIYNLESKAKEVDWMMEPWGFQKCTVL